jgi:hypothetical protein
MEDKEKIKLLEEKILLLEEIIRLKDLCKKEITYFPFPYPCVPYYYQPPIITTTAPITYSSGNT